MQTIRHPHDVGSGMFRLESHARDSDLLVFHPAPSPLPFGLIVWIWNLVFATHQKRISN
jgi:hypothetical protein